MKERLPKIQEPSEESTFDWARQWYPLAFVEDLDPGRPHAMELLGKRLVIWYDSQQKKWTAFEDRCPHRLAPLSGALLSQTDAYVTHLHRSHHDCLTKNTQENKFHAVNPTLPCGWMIWQLCTYSGPSERVTWFL